MPSFVRLQALGLVVGLVSGACARGPASPARERNPAQVTLLDGRPVTPRRSIRQVQTFACARDAASDPDIRAAREDLRIEAARLGGDVVGNIMCHEEDARRHSDCWKVARCTGDVFRTH